MTMVMLLFLRKCFGNRVLRVPINVFLCIKQKKTKEERKKEKSDCRIEIVWLHSLINLIYCFFCPFLFRLHIYTYSKYYTICESIDWHYRFIPWEAPFIENIPFSLSFDTLKLRFCINLYVNIYIYFFLHSYVVIWILNSEWLSLSKR